MKLKNVGIQVAEKKHLAELIVNNMTMIEGASSSDVKFAKLPSETNFKSVKDIQESCSVDDLVNVRGKFLMDICTAEEKIVRGQQKTMMESYVLMDDTGFVNVTLWANFIPHLEELVSSGNVFLEFEGLRVKVFNKHLYLTTTESYTSVKTTDPVNLGDTEKSYQEVKEKEPKQTAQIDIPRFHAVSNYSKFYICTNCTKPFITCMDTLEGNKVECTGCGSRQHLDGLDKGVSVTVKAPGCNKLMTMSTEVIKKALSICFDENVDILHLDSEKLMDMVLDVEKVQITVNYINNEIQDVVKQRE